MNAPTTTSKKPGRGTECPICGQAHSGKRMQSHLNIHKKDAERGKEFKCEYCDEKFRDRIFEQIHLDREHPRRFDKDEQERILRDKHDVSKNGGKCNESGKSPIMKNYNCIHCEETFENKKMWKIHVDSYHQMDCQLCGIHFQRTSALREHLLSLHPDMESYECRICKDKQFSQLHLKTHMKMHELTKLEELQTCLYCEDKFEDLCTFGTHIRDKHDNKRIKSMYYGKPCYKCPACDHTNFVFALLTHYKNEHLRFDQVEIFKCLYCPSQFTQLSERYRHSQEHINGDLEVHFNCRYCPETFEAPEAFAKHCMEPEASRPLECLYCTTKFDKKHRGPVAAQRGPKYEFFCRKCGHNIHGIIKYLQHLDTHIEKQRDIVKAKRKLSRRKKTKRFAKKNCEKSDSYWAISDLPVPTKKDVKFDESLQQHNISALNLSNESTNFPMAVALSKELLENKNSCCIVWIKKLEKNVDTVLLASINPVRCFLCVTEPKCSSSRNLDEHSNKIMMKIKLKIGISKDVMINCPLELQLDCLQFESLHNFEELLKNVTNMKELVHFVRITNQNIMNALSENILSKTVICNYV